MSTRRSEPTNGGLNWENQISGTTNNLFSIYFTDSNNGWAVGGDWLAEKRIIINTTDGGLNWITQLSRAVAGSVKLPGISTMKATIPIINSGAVSPKARAMPIIVPVSMPGRARGST